MSTDLVTTTEASELTGRSPASLRTAISRGFLTVVRRTELGRPLLDRAAVLEWHQKAGTRPSTTRRPSWERTGDILAEYGPATVDELANLLSLNEGNVRKHLAILATHGAADRLPDGQWISTFARTTTGAA